LKTKKELYTYHATARTTSAREYNRNSITTSERSVNERTKTIMTIVGSLEREQYYSLVNRWKIMVSTYNQGRRLKEDGREGENRIQRFGGR
jgi:hypothetical protein